MLTNVPINSLLARMVGTARTMSAPSNVIVRTDGPEIRVTKVDIFTYYSIYSTELNYSIVLISINTFCQLKLRIAYSFNRILIS